MGCVVWCLRSVVVVVCAAVEVFRVVVRCCVLCVFVLCYIYVCYVCVVCMLCCVDFVVGIAV